MLKKVKGTIHGHEIYTDESLFPTCSNRGILASLPGPGDRCDASGVRKAGTTVMTSRGGRAILLAKHTKEAFAYRERVAVVGFVAGWGRAEQVRQRTGRRIRPPARDCRKMVKGSRN